jgi:predicted GTPase
MKKVIIIGAAGRDFHNFNTFFRQNDEYHVVAFTAAQIPNIDGRIYLPELAGSLYPRGIPVYLENELPDLIKSHQVDVCVFSYSDVPYTRVMSLSAIVNAAGASFMLLGPRQTMLKSAKPVIAVCATRTGCGKSQTSRKVFEILKFRGLKTVVVRHPMPYGNLVDQKVQRFASVDDLKRHNCTIEEMEDYEPHIINGAIIYAGVDYEAILRAAENDPDGCDVILWDGGNNDFPFFAPDIWITVADPHRAGHELSYYPGEVNLRMANIIIINKIDSSSLQDIETIRRNILKVNAQATVIDAASPIRVSNPELIKGKRVLVVEDGPTLTHGEMKFGAGTVAANKYGALEIVDPRPFVVGKLAETFQLYLNIGCLLPAMGYGNEQVHDLEKTINATRCDSVIIATPMDLNRVIKIQHPTVRVSYELQEIGEPTLEQCLSKLLK